MDKVGTARSGCGLTIWILCASAIVLAGERTFDERAVAIVPLAPVPGVKSIQKLITRGSIEYILDQQTHRLFLHDVATGRTDTYGRIGNDRGDLYYPFDFAVSQTGSIAIKDLGNSRIVLMDAERHVLWTLPDLPRTIGIAID